MTKELIQKSIEIQAGPQRIWEVLTDDRYTRQWYASFTEGAYADTDWKEGSKAVFLDGKGDGMIGHIVANRMGEVIDIEFEGFIMNGKEDYESEGARAVKGTHEIYRLKGDKGRYTLSIELETGSDFAEMMSQSWDKALVEIKKLSEEQP